MENRENEIKIPKKEYCFICKMLYKKNNVKLLVSNRENILREILISDMRVTTNSYLKSFHNDYNTLENIVVKIADDWLIKKYKKCGKIIEQNLNALKKSSPIYYEIIIDKYYKKIDLKTISQKYELNYTEIKSICRKIISNIYKDGIKNDIFLEVI